MKGRKKLAHSDPTFLPRLKELWKKTRKNIPEMARELEVSPRTIYVYLNQAGVSTKRAAKPAGHLVPRHHHGGLAKWVRTHPDEPLASSVQEIVAQTGCTSDQIRSYLYRKRLYVKKLFASLPRLESLPLRLTSLSVKKVETKNWKTYRLLVDMKGSVVKIEANGELFHFPIDRFMSKLGKVISTS